VALTQHPQSPEPSAEPASSPPPPAMSPWRAMLIGGLLIPLNVFWITVIDIRWYGLDSTDLPLFITPVFFLFGLVLINFAWRKFAGRGGRPLRQEELLLIYIMLVTSCTFAGEDTLQNLFGTIGHPYWFADKQNQWQSLFFRFLPSWLLVTNHDALRGFYEGGVNIYSPSGQRYLMSWAVPLAVWGAFFLVLVGMYLCLTILIRRAWIENERLTFPLVQLPLAMTADDAGTTFFRNPRMWAGFGIAFAISVLNGIHMLIPVVPTSNVKLFHIDTWFTTPPWNAIGSTQTSFYPFMIGIAYFMPLDLSFSCWFFYILARVFRVTGAIYGWDSNSNGFPFFGEQATGAWVGLGLMLLYAGRNYWRSVFLSAWQGPRAADPPEARRYRYAIGGLIVGGLLLAIFSALIGLSGWVALVFFGFLLGFVITRVRAEFGSPHEIVWVNPDQVLVTLFGTSALGSQNLSVLSVLYWFNRGYRNHPMPNQLEAFKMLDDKPAVRFGGLIGTLCLSFAVSLLAAYWANLHVTYAAGAGAKALGFKSWVGWETYNRLQSWLTQPTPPASTGLYYILGGFVLTVILAILRTQFVWWPFHPAGYALALSYAMEYFWLPVFIAWFLKACIIRYGGVKLYRLAVPFFLGLILGDYTAGSLWALLGCAMHIPTYKIFL
jgi:hypothetical protein